MELIKNYIFQQVASNNLSPDDAKEMLNELKIRQSRNGGDIAIIGMACRFPCADNIDEYWNNLIHGDDCIRTLSEARRKDAELLFPGISGTGEASGNQNASGDVLSKGGFLREIDKFDADFFRISPMEAYYMDPLQRLCLEVSWQAIENAGYGGDRIIGSNTGVFIGNDFTNTSAYKYITEPDPLQVTGSWTSIMTSRISYILDLKGPAVTIDTACSSGVTAVHQACRSLKEKECDYAVAGGICILYASGRKGGSSQMEMMESDDGIVRTFDQKADGTVWGEGIGTVFLKPLNKAIADGDHIYAVIKGSALNNDGASNGITAPSAEAQERVILDAWKDAGIKPDTVSYIEAHGTGTILGDPIEIKGLTGAFRKHTSKKQFCGIGSVKTNLGHLVGASGMASLIKVVLAMKKGLIPATINFKECNKYISFQDSPVYVVDRPIRWGGDESPRRAGVSSFGFSGTNCHLVLEEAPAVIGNPASGEEGLCILALSARNKKILEDYVEEYYRFLQRESPPSVEDLCYTANTGRRHLPSRLCLVVSGLEDLKQKIELLCRKGIDNYSLDGISFSEYKVVSEKKEKRKPGEVTGIQLKQISDAAVKILDEVKNQKVVSRELLERLCALYVGGADFSWERLYEGSKRRKVSIPGYPLERVRYWPERNTEIRGERRNAEDDIHPLLDRMLADTMFETVYSTAFSLNKHWVLRDHTILGRGVVPGTAYLEIARVCAERYFNIQGRYNMEMRDILFITPLEVEEGELREVHTVVREANGYLEFFIASKQKSEDHGKARDWRKHAEGKIAFIPVEEGKNYKYLPGLKEMLQNRSSIKGMMNAGKTDGPIVFGPRWDNISGIFQGDGDMLVELALPMELLGDMEKYVLHPALLDNAVNIAMAANSRGNIYLPLSYESFKLYNPMPASFYSHLRLQSGGGNSESMSFNILLADMDGIIFAEIKDYTVKKVRQTGWEAADSVTTDRMFHEIGCVEAELDKPVDVANDNYTLVFLDCENIGRELIDAVKNWGICPITVVKGTSYCRKAEDSYAIGDSEEDYRRVIGEAGGAENLRIIYMGGIGTDENPKEIQELETELRKGLYNLFYLIRALAAERLTQSTELIVVTDYANEVTGSEDSLHPHNAMLFALANVAGQEYPGLKVRCIDMDRHTPADTIAHEIMQGANPARISFRSGKRYIEGLKEMHIRKEVDDKVRTKEQGVYIITGGMGGIGLAVGKRLASRGRVNLALVSRTGLPERAEWDRIAAAGDKKYSNKIATVREMENMGATVEICIADVAKEEELKYVLDELRRKYGRINGIIHCAGIAGEGLMLRKSEDAFKRVLAPKVQGTWILDKLTAGDEPDFFILFSSVSAFLGGMGQGDYAAANSFMDLYAAFRTHQGRRMTSINWPAWKETGMAVDYGMNGEDGIISPIGNEEALNAFEKVINCQPSRVLVCRFKGSGEPLYKDKVQTLASRSPDTNTDAVRNAGSKEVCILGKEDGHYTDTERLVATVWGEILGRPEVDIYDSFYDLGGDSIQAIKIANILGRILAIHIDMNVLFENLTVCDLAAYLAGLASAPGPEDKKDTSVTDTICGLSHAQERIWFLQKLYPGLVAYNLPTISLIKEKVDPVILDQALKVVWDRHDALRMLFFEEDGLPGQIVMKHSNIALEYVDISTMQDKRSLLNELIHKDNGTVFDLSKSTSTVKLYKLDEEEYCLYINIHHIIIDGMSMGIVLNEIISAYYAYLNGKEADLPPAGTSYADYIRKQKEWLQSDICRRMKAYWLDELAGPLPVLNLPTDFMRSKVQEYRGSFVKTVIGHEQAIKLKNLAKGMNLTLHMLFLSAYFLFLHKITDDSDIIVGIPASGRDDKELENTVGILINNLCIRVGFDEISTYRELTDHVKDKSLKAYKNSRVPFDLLVRELNPERDTSRSPIFSTMFQFFENIPQENEGISLYDLSLLCKESEDGIDIRFEFNTDIYRRETIEYYLTYFENMLMHVCSNRGIKLEDIDMLSEDDGKSLSTMFTDMNPEIPGGYTIYELFEQKAETNPGATAVVCGLESLSYGILNEKANRLANFLRKQGIKPDEPVGILMERGVELIAGILGILKAGGAYVPIDPAYPAARVEYMLKHSGMKILVTGGKWAEKAIELSQSTNRNDGRVEVLIDMTGHASYEITDNLCIYRGDAVMAESSANPLPVNHMQNLMYVIYTSGSTGLPKGVMVTHSNAVNYIQWSIHAMALNSRDTMMLVTSVSFDISVFEIFGALLSGACLVIVPDEKLRDPAELMEYMDKTGVTIWHSVPTLMSQMLLSLNKEKLEHYSTCLQRIRLVMLGGEAWSAELARDIRKTLGRARIVNMYGPTEATIWVTSYIIGEELDHLSTIPIGKPVCNNRILILNKSGKLCGVGVPGEICICGKNVTRGYFKDPGKTADVFIQMGESGEIVYKTGDTGKYLYNGNIEYIGRRDDMVKVRGYRIEIGEIESVMLEYQTVKEVAVIARKAGESNRLVCFYVSGRELSIDGMRRHLQLKLPEYMIPSQFIHMDQMPLTPNGKIDRRALSNMEITNRPLLENEYVSPATEIETFLAGVWQRLLNTERIGIHDNFFAIGGDSFLANRMYAKIQEKYPVQVTIVDIFTYPTITKLSEYIRDKNSIEDEKSNVSMEEELESLFADMEKGEIGLEEAVRKINEMK